LRPNEWQAEPVTSSRVAMFMFSASRAARCYWFTAENWVTTGCL